MKCHLCPFGEHGRIDLVLHRGEREGESQFVPEMIIHQNMEQQK
jgi:hypothetical protein